MAISPCLEARVGGAAGRVPPSSGRAFFGLESWAGEPRFPVPETVAVAQLVEPLIVIQVVAGSSPVGHPS